MHVSSLFIILKFQHFTYEKDRDGLSPINCYFTLKVNMIQLCPDLCRQLIDTKSKHDSALS
jgi:hypothetical protein